MTVARFPQRIGQVILSVQIVGLMITPALAADDASTAWAALVRAATSP